MAAAPEQEQPLGVKRTAPTAALAAPQAADSLMAAVTAHEPVYRLYRWFLTLRHQTYRRTASGPTLS